MEFVYRKGKMPNRSQICFISTRSQFMLNRVS